jgi:hypothetical protein
MDVLFTWKTLRDDCFKKQVQFTYGNATTDNLDGWNSTHEDLLIDITIYPCDKVSDKESYFLPEETFAMVFSWRGDSRFSGSSPFLEYQFQVPLHITHIIPKGTCGSRLEAECCLVIKDPAMLHGDWHRPPGSIIGVIPIIEKITIDKGAWFPIEEYEGNGGTLLHWEFINMDNLELSVSSCFLVLVDTKHPMAAILGSTPEGQSLLTLLIVQACARKVLTDEVYEQLKIKHEAEEVWISGSAGACFDFIMKKMLSTAGFNSFDALKSAFLEAPERIDEIVDHAFSAGFISSFKK